MTAESLEGSSTAGPPPLPVNTPPIHRYRLVLSAIEFRNSYCLSNDGWETLTDDHYRRVMCPEKLKRNVLNVQKLSRYPVYVPNTDYIGKKL